MKAQTFKQWLAESEADLSDSLLFPDWQEWVDKPDWMIGAVTIRVPWDPTWNLESKVTEWCREVARKMNGECRPIWARSEPMLSYTKRPVTTWEIRIVWAGLFASNSDLWEWHWDSTVLNNEKSSVDGVNQIQLNRKFVPQAWISAIISWNGDTLTAEDLLTMDKLLEPAKQSDPWAGRLQDKIRTLPNWPGDVTNWALGDW